MDHPVPCGRPSTVAVFVAPSYLDQARLRLWAKTVETELVLLTDDPTDANAVIARQLRCSGVSSAVVRVTGTLRSTLAIELARERRDHLMARLADKVIDFGKLNSRRFPGIQTTGYE